MKEVIHLRGLNGIRAIASLSVLFSHTTLGLNSFGLNSFIFGEYSDGSPKTTLLAGFGVSIFFTLSGFLITFLLLEEKVYAEINIKNFYFRRILRIWPLYYLYLIIVLVTLSLFSISFDNKLIIYYIFLSANIPFISGTGIILLQHYWSLAVEEQFYSFWPWIVKNSSSLLKTTVFICFSLILVKCTLRFIDIAYNHGIMSWSYTAIHVSRFHCMLIGAIAAILYKQKSFLFLKITNNLALQAVSWVSILFLGLNKFHIISVLDNEIISIITIFLIIGQIEKTNRIINLDNLFFDFIGKISYGIYMIHPLLIYYLSKVISFSDKTNPYNYLYIYISIFLLTIILAFLSYEYFEKKFLKIKIKYSTVNSSV